MSVSTAAAAQSVCAPLPVLGRDVTVPLVTGGEVTYAALDYAASAPALQRVWDDVAAYAPVLRQRPPRRRLPLPAVDRPLRERPQDRRASSSTAGPTTRWSSPAPPPTRSTCSPPPSPPTARSSSSRPSTTPRCCPGGTPGSPTSTRPRTPRQAVATLERRSPAATRTGRRWCASPAPPTSPASCGPYGSWPPPRTRTAPGSSSTPPSSPRTTPSPSGTWTSTGSPSPATSCTRRSAPACWPGRADWLREADPYLAGGGASRKVTRRADGGVDVEWHDERRPARGRLAERHRRLLHRLRLQGPHRGRLRHAGRPRAAPDRHRAGRARRGARGARPLPLRRRRPARRRHLLRRRGLEQLALRRRALRRVRHRRARRPLLRPPAGPHPPRQRPADPGRVRRPRGGARREVPQRDPGELRRGHPGRARGAVRGRGEGARAGRRAVERTGRRTAAASRRSDRPDRPDSVPSPWGSAAGRRGPRGGSPPAAESPDRRQASRPMANAASRSCCEYVRNATCVSVASHPRNLADAAGDDVRQVLVLPSPAPWRSGRTYR